MQPDELVRRIKADYTKREHMQVQEPLPINVFTINDEGESSTILNGQFVSSQLLIDVLLRMKQTSTDKNELIDICKKKYENNNSELTILHEFEQTYSSEQALWWYTRESFLYKILNKALRVQNVDLLFLFRFFIRDIHYQLKQRHCLSSTRVYRRQLMSSKELKLLQDSIGEMISMNSFLSTSLNRELTLFPFKDVERSDDLRQILFEIDAEPRSGEHKPFANISDLSYFPNEDEILFMVGSVFRLTNIHLEGRVWLVRMTLCSNDDHDLKRLSEHMKRAYGGGELSFIKFGHVLADMGKLDQADKYYRRLFSELPSNQSTSKDVADLYSSLGIVASDKGDYSRSLEWYKQSLEIRMRIDQLNYEEIGNTFSNMGEAHRLNGDLEMALESYNKALTVFKQAHAENHPRIAGFLCNIGIVYQYQDKHTEALHFYKKALAIQQKYLPPNHPELAIYYNNIGIFHHVLKQYDLALQYLNTSLKIRLQSLSPQHDLIASSYRNIGLVYDHKNELEQALVYYQKAATIYRNILPVHHPDVAEIEENIQRVSAKLK